MTSLPDKILAIDAALDDAGIPHAFGGTLALAWCTQRARGTVDIDCNVFAPVESVAATLDAMPREVTATAANRAALARDGQVRLWWDETPIDLFMNTTEFHEEVAARARRESFAGRNLPFLSCTDLAVFKAFFNRTHATGPTSRRWRTPERSTSTVSSASSCATSARPTSASSGRRVSARADGDASHVGCAHGRGGAG